MSEHLLSMFEALGTTLEKIEKKYPAAQESIWDALEVPETPSMGDPWAVSSVSRSSEKKAF